MDQEIEIKFYLADFASFRQRLVEAGAEQTQAPVRETNLRFDDAEQHLRDKAQVLRLRQDHAAHLTFKGPGALVDGVLTRTEIEFESSDFATARRFLEALDYKVFMTYEKVRENFYLDGVQVSLDEMPFGFFVELEGQTAQQIRALARRLGLDWSRGINISYLGLFEALKSRCGLSLDDLSFAAFKDIAVSVSDLGVKPADAPAAGLD